MQKFARHNFLAPFFEIHHAAKWFIDLMTFTFLWSFLIGKKGKGCPKLELGIFNMNIKD